MFKFFVVSLVVAFLCLNSSIASTHSIDPEGKLFIERTGGDLLHCGPLVAMMARRYADVSYQPKKKLQEIANARALVSDFQGLKAEAEFNRWWHFKDIATYLKFMGIRHQLGKLSKERDAEHQIKQLLDDKEMVLVNVNMNHIPRGRAANKPYLTFYIPGGWGHFLAVVGYQYKDKNLYFEVHDSFSPLGKNRLYSAKHIVGSMKAYEPSFIHVQQGV